MNYVTVFDTAVSSRNLGDQIIMDAVQNYLVKMLPDSFFFNLPTHDYIGEEGYKLLNDSKYVFVGGTNLLSSNMNKYNQWKLAVRDFWKVSDVILMGVGWWQYQEPPNRYTRHLLRRVLSSNMLHSVRDSYTESMLRSAGISNVINTGCPTMWGLDEAHCDEIPRQKSNIAVMTFTDYKPNVGADKRLFEIVRRNYEDVYIWLQGSRDAEYVRSVIGSADARVLGFGLNAYDGLLAANKGRVDYVGTRLHAGIRALQHKCRAIIVGVDNRATEKKRDFNLMVVDRKDVNDIADIIHEPIDTEIHLPHKNLSRWIGQFSTVREGA